MVLALWAVAMPAGTGTPFGMAAVSALHEQLAGVRCSASSDRIDGVQMTG
jgi:hypothetical protein